MIKLHPYIKLGDTWTLTDEQIHTLWNKLKEDGTSQILKTSDDTQTGDDLLEFLQTPGIHPVFVINDGDVMGLAWLTEVKSNHATAHFILFKETWGKPLAQEIGIEVLNNWFSWKGPNGESLDIILGMLHAKYRTAIKSIEKLGFEIVGNIPLIFNGQDACISYILRDDFYQKYDLKPIDFDAAQQMEIISSFPQLGTAGEFNDDHKRVMDKAMNEKATEAAKEGSEIIKSAI